MGASLSSERALVSCGRDTLMPASTSNFPSEPVRTAILPPEPSGTVTFPRNLYAVTGDAAALSLIRVTSPNANSARVLPDSGFLQASQKGTVSGFVEGAVGLTRILLDWPL